MKNWKHFILAAILACGCAVVPAEAATVAIMPLINRVEFATPEAEQEPNQIFYNEALGVLKKRPGYMLVDTDRLRHAIRQNVVPGQLPTKEQLMTVTKKGNVDLVLCMELTGYSKKPVQRSMHEINVQMNVQGNLVAYNRLTGKYLVKKCKDDRIIDATLTSRWDVVQESWVRMVRREIERLTK